METDLYIKIQKKLVRGFNIQTLEATKWLDKEGNEVGSVKITYLYGQTLIIPVNPALTTSELQDILEQINIVQATGCYPQSDSTCELGITSLN